MKEPAEGNSDFHPYDIISERRIQGRPNRTFYCWQPFLGEETLFVGSNLFGQLSFVRFFPACFFFLH
jgi:hypothetical protein